MNDWSYLILLIAGLIIYSVFAEKCYEMENLHASQFNRRAYNLILSCSTGGACLALYSLLSIVQRAYIRSGCDNEVKYRHSLINIIKELKKTLRSFKKNKRGAVTIGGIILMVLAVWVAAILLPDAFLTVADANTTGWNTAVITMFQILLPIVATIGIMLKFLPSLKS